jgi:8-oxo-dGTP diphosphatase
MKLLYGTGNAAKLEVMRRALAGLVTGSELSAREGGEFYMGEPLEILGLSDMEREAPPVPEDGSSPLENARQKALAYYAFFGVPVFSCDSGLYFEGLPEAIQPGVHVRTVKGKYLTDEEMQAYYGGLAAKYGDLRARYHNAICLVLDRDHVYECMDESLVSEVFLITSKPWSGVRRKGFPLDSLSVDVRTGKYYYELEQEYVDSSIANADELALDEGFRGFFRKLWADGVFS